MHKINNDVHNSYVVTDLMLKQNLLKSQLIPSVCLAKGKRNFFCALYFKFEQYPCTSECQLIMPEKLPVKLSTSQNQGLCLQSLNPAYNFSDKHLQQSSHTSLSQLPALVTSMDTYPDTSPGQSVPLHAIPENLNMKVSA